MKVVDPDLSLLRARGGEVLLLKQQISEYEITVQKIVLLQEESVCLVGTYLIFVTDATDGVCVNFFVRCNFFPD